MNPRFEDIVDEDLSPAERERLERVHDLLVAAGPPAELSPHLERGPTLGMTLARKRRSGQRRLALLAAAIAVLAVVFVAGFAVGNSGNGLVGTHTLKARSRRRVRSRRS
jgi:F0F1-type ATP synthase membrane subunit c/vacuolar-type H+-ATPase subunit K